MKIKRQFNIGVTLLSNTAIAVPMTIHRCNNYLISPTYDDLKSVISILKTALYLFYTKEAERQNC